MNLYTVTISYITKDGLRSVPLIFQKHPTAEEVLVAHWEFSKLPLDDSQSALLTTMLDSLLDASVEAGNVKSAEYNDAVYMVFSKNKIFNNEGK